MKIALLPGLDGTARLFEPFLSRCPSDVSPIPIAYPPREPLGYARLLERVGSEIPADCRVIVAESFSGPLAIRLVCGSGGRFTDLVLVATFARSPAPWLLNRLPWWRFPPRSPSLASIRWRLTGGDRDVARAVRDANAEVAKEVIVHRLREIARVDERESLRHCPARVLCLAPTRDRLVGHRRFSEIARLAPRSTLVSVEGPHLLIQCRPEACWAAIRDFLRH